MEKFATNKKLLRQLTLMNNHKEPSGEVLDSLFAQMFLEISVYQNNKVRIEKEIDHVLEKGNKEKFATLAKEYNELMKKYKDGITVFEKDFEFTIDVEEYTM